MKALLVTTVERVTLKTMGAKVEIKRCILIIPWKEIASIDVGTEEQTTIIERIDDPALEVEYMEAVDLSNKNQLGMKEFAHAPREFIKAITNRTKNNPEKMERPKAWPPPPERKS